MAARRRSPRLSMKMRRAGPLDDVEEVVEPFVEVEVHGGAVHQLDVLPEKLAQRGHESTARRGRPPAGTKPQQIVLKQLSIKLRGRRNLRSALGHPATELLEVQQVAQHRLGA